MTCDIMTYGAKPYDDIWYVIWYDTWYDVWNYVKNLVNNIEKPTCNREHQKGNGRQPMRDIKQISSQPITKQEWV